jgi:hypothetical protein
LPHLNIRQNNLAFLKEHHHHAYQSAVQSSGFSIRVDARIYSAAPVPKNLPLDNRCLLWRVADQEHTRIKTKTGGQHSRPPVI